MFREKGELILLVVYDPNNLENLSLEKSCEF